MALLRNAAGESVKQCSICKEIKLVIEFYETSPSHQNRRDSYQPYCKICQNDKRKALELNLTVEEYQRRKELKPEQCEICDRNKKLVLDHNHKTGKIRGWICINCNRYLESHGGARWYINYKQTQEYLLKYDPTEVSQS